MNSADRAPVGFSDLLSEIEQSEAKAKQRRKLITEAKEQITSLQSELRLLKDEDKVLQSQLKYKEADIIIAETNLQWLETRLSVLMKQKNKLSSECKSLDFTKKTALAQSDQERESFYNEVMAFLMEYDSCSGGTDRREAEACIKLQQTKQDVSKLETDLQALAREAAAIHELDEKNKNLTTIKANLVKQLEEVDIEIIDLNTATEALTEEKAKLFSMPQTDPEFKRLQAQLSHALTNSVEDECCVLGLELQELKRQCHEAEERKCELQKALAKQNHAMVQSNQQISLHTQSNLTHTSANFSNYTSTSKANVNRMSNNHRQQGREKKRVRFDT